jgi:hypothetical protein
MAESQGRLSFKGRPLSVRGLAKGQSQRPSTCRRALEPADDPRARMRLQEHQAQPHELLPRRGRVLIPRLRPSYQGTGFVITTRHSHPNQLRVTDEREIDRSKVVA